jgi:iron-sulfur cluster insertion protein
MEVVIDANFGMALGSSSAETMLEFSDSAVRKLKSLQAEEGNPELMLRVSVYGGGCSGFQYTFSLDEEVKPTDKTVQKDGATLIIDQKSYQYLAGSEMFVVNNPNATSTCGCGASFSI